MLINFDILKSFWNGLTVNISDKIKKSRGDWNQNNPEADNYIKNRPFYSESQTTETVILPSTDVECIYNDGIYAYVAESNVILLADMDYRVTFDGVEYNCRCVGDDTQSFLGNVGAFGMPGFSETGEPFMVIRDGSTFIVATFDTEATTHNISITEINIHTTIKKIDNQYLPAMDYVSYAETQDLTNEQKI